MECGDCKVAGILVEITLEAFCSFSICTKASSRCKVQNLSRIRVALC